MSIGDSIFDRVFFLRSRTSHNKFSLCQSCTRMKLVNFKQLFPISDRLYSFLYANERILTETTSSLLVYIKETILKFIVVINKPL